MSVDCCYACGNFVDTDFDCGAYGFWKRPDKCNCCVCRESLTLSKVFNKASEVHNGYTIDWMVM